MFSQLTLKTLRVLINLKGRNIKPTSMIRGKVIGTKIPITIKIDFYFIVDLTNISVQELIFYKLKL
jgi:hypothetical protein